MRRLKSERIAGVGGMLILYEERRLYGAESEINTGFFEEILEDCHEADVTQKKHKE